MAAFANLCFSSGALRRLRSFTLTVYLQMIQIYQKDWVKHVVHLLSDSPLEIFQIYSASLSLDSLATDELWTQLILTHGKRLLRFSVHRTLISWKAIHNICVQCIKLEQLFLVVDPDLLVRILTFWKISYSKRLERRINWVFPYLSQRHWGQSTLTIPWEHRALASPAFLHLRRFCLFSTSAVRRLLSLDVMLKYGRSVQLDDREKCSC